MKYVYSPTNGYGYGLKIIEGETAYDVVTSGKRPSLEYYDYIGKLKDIMGESGVADYSYISEEEEEKEEEIFEKYPKIESPFVREGNTIINNIKKDYEWVFQSDNVIAVEKLDGENIGVHFKNGKVKSIYTRNGNKKTIAKGDTEYVEAIANSMKKDWDKYINTKNSLEYGELVGPKIKGNPYDLDKHLWVPFKRSREKLTYNSWGEYPKTYESINNWFNPNKNGLIPLFYSNRHGLNFDEAKEKDYVEGVIFYNTKTKEKAKLRIDMFPWHNKNTD